MISETAINERRAVAAAADEYRSKGYEVTRNVLLGFGSDLVADLVIRKGDEVRVVEVRARSSLTVDGKTRRLREAVYAKPGWHFDLILVGKGEEVGTPAGKTQLPTWDGVARRLEEAEAVLAQGYAESAFLMAWAAGEAAMLAALITAGVSAEQAAGPGDPFQHAVFLGIIFHDEQHYFDRMREYRNAIIHGYGVDDFDPAMAAELIETIRGILTTDEAGGLAVPECRLPPKCCR